MQEDDDIPSGRWLPPREAPRLPESLSALEALRALIEKDLQETQVLLDDVLRQRESLQKRRATRGES